MTVITRMVSLCNFTLASTSLGVQLLLLYPWHLQIDESHHKLTEQVNRIEKRLDLLSKDANPNTALDALVSRPLPTIPQQLKK